jgi:ABC-type thiamin/hydroxymethylpyrimidine transport system permease subunit
METFLSICLGIGLSAACGFRVFVPLLFLSIAALSGHVHLAQGFAWIGTYPALTVFGVATVLEIGAYYIPFLDNLLDSIAIPAAVVAGAMVTASCVTGMSPMLKWTLAIIAGGGAAATTQVVTTKLRALSSATTAGLGNSVLATAEAGGSAGLSLISVLWPIVGMILTVLLLISGLFLVVYLSKKILRWLKRTSSPTAAAAGTLG